MIEYLMKLVKSEIFKDDSEIAAPLSVSIEDAEQLYKLARSHDLAHIVGAAADRLKLFEGTELASKFSKQIFAAVYRYRMLDLELKKLTDALNKAKIPHIPLKGSVIRKYYPEPWMRTSCDIDVLVSEADLAAAADALVGGLGYTNEGKGSHDITLISPSKVHIELHYKLVEDNIAPQIDKPLLEPWKYASPAQENSYTYEFSDDMYYYYHVAHMAKHYVNGGCGVRPFIDLKILNGLSEFDRDKRESLLSEGGLLQFESNAVLLAEVWFGQSLHTELTKTMEEYLLCAGVYGSMQNQVAVKQAKQGKFRYLLTRIWMPYNQLKYKYPSLEGKKILLPFYEVRRWFSLIFKKHRSRSLNELKISNSMTDDQSRRTLNMLADLELYKK